MVYLHDIMDPASLDDNIKAGLVSVRYHDQFRLAVLNYTPECQYSNTWNEVTTQCRGLIYNVDTLELVARPFTKFMNWDQSNAPFPPSGPCLRMEKADGSLGILYPIVEKSPGSVTVSYRIATRGSFHSEQADWATRFLWSAPGFNGDGFVPLRDKTYLFEIIYEDNRIVVDYSGYEGLMLIDVIDNETGHSDIDEFDNCEWPDKVGRTPMPGFDSGQVVDIPDRGEGFVYLWPVKNVRYKMKSAWYVEMHKLVTGLSEKVIWQHLCSGKTIDELKVRLPEEFHDWIDKVAGKIQEDSDAIVQRCYGKFRDYSWQIPHDQNIDRKHFAINFSKDIDRKYMFCLLDGKSIYPIALAASKPVNTKPMVDDES